MLDRGTDRDELGHVRPPFVAPDVQSHADDPVRPELIGLLLHAGHGEVTRAVHGLRERVQLAAGGGPRDLDADVEDRASHHEPDRIEPGLADQQELVHAQVRGVEALAVLREPLDPGLGNPLDRLRVVFSHRIYRYIYI
jgi:hypothetical protein